MVDIGAGKRSGDVRDTDLGLDDTNVNNGSGDSGGDVTSGVGLAENVDARHDPGDVVIDEMDGGQHGRRDPGSVTGNADDGTTYMVPGMGAAYSGETSGQDAVRHGPGDMVNIVGQGTSSGSGGGQQGPGTSSNMIDVTRQIR